MAAQSYMPAPSPGTAGGKGGGNPDGVEGGKPGDPDFQRMIRRPHPTT